jgi:hypothetical protein
LTLYEADPVGDQRWAQLVERSPQSSVFHSVSWLRALRDTYGYTPVAFTDSAPGESLRHGLLFCQIKSWLTGRRLVSLPFSDHCEPLMDADTLASMLESLRVKVAAKERYVELRPLRLPLVASRFGNSETFWFHAIDLRPSLDEVFGRFHKNHVQRTIRKAERSVVCEVGQSDRHLEAFYALHRGTRRKHGAPLQPFAWFQNLAKSFGEQLSVYLASYEERPAAALLMLRHKASLVYKYGASDTSLNRYGGTALLFWKAIQAAKEIGLEALDLGRSDLDQDGLVAFKDHLGGVREPLHYYRHPVPAEATPLRGTLSVARRAFSYVPTPIQDVVGRGLFKHFG